MRNRKQMTLAEIAFESTPLHQEISGCFMNIQQHQDAQQIVARNLIYDYAYSNNTNHFYNDIEDTSEGPESGIKYDFILAI